MTTSARTMSAMCASSPDPASLTSETVPVPDPGPGEVLVEVHATAVTAGELSWPESWPAIPCHDLSGVVAETGSEVAGWRPGDEVYSLVAFDRPGAAAEYVTTSAADLAAKPSGVGHVEAASVPLGALTAWQALHEHARLQPGQHVLVHGGAGGVGIYAVQLASLYGARVTATASARDAEFVAGLGADDVLDYTGRFEDHVHDVDVVVDPVGGEVMARSWPVLRSGGILVAIAEEPDGDHGGRDDVREVYFVVTPDGGQLGELAALVSSQQLRPAVSAVFGLADLAAAFLAQRPARGPGKVIIKVDQGGARTGRTLPGSAESQAGPRQRPPLFPLSGPAGLRATGLPGRPARKPVTFHRSTISGYVAHPCRWSNSRLAETVRETPRAGPSIKLAAPSEASNYRGEAS